MILLELGFDNYGYLLRVWCFSPVVGKASSRVKASMREDCIWRVLLGITFRGKLGGDNKELHLCAFRGKLGDIFEDSVQGSDSRTGFEISFRGLRSRTAF